MNEVIDPVTGMPIPTQQPINVGMPGSKPIPANVAHNIQQPVQTGQRILNPIAPMMRTDPPKKPVGAVEDIYETATRGFTDAVLAVPQVFTGKTDQLGMHSKKWLKEKKERAPKKPGEKGYGKSTVES